MPSAAEAKSSSSKKIRPPPAKKQVEMKSIARRDKTLYTGQEKASEKREETTFSALTRQIQYATTTKSIERERDGERDEMF
jgi:hypothetical protein